MKWLKQGLVIRPHKNLEWMQTHAGVPFAEHIQNDLFRI